eukprot:3084144-Prymnesium_polylepis.1
MAYAICAPPYTSLRCRARASMTACRRRCRTRHSITVTCRKASFPGFLSADFDSISMHAAGRGSRLPRTPP